MNIGVFIAIMVGSSVAIGAGIFLAIKNNGKK